MSTPQDYISVRIPKRKITVFVGNLSTAIVVDQKRRVPFRARHRHRHQPAAALRGNRAQGPARPRRVVRSREVAERGRDPAQGRKTIDMEFEGVEAKFDRLFIQADGDGTSDRDRRRAHPAGAVRAAAGVAARGPADAAGPRDRAIVDEAVSRVGALIDMGLGYLTLERETSTHSGGESQRIEMVRRRADRLRGATWPGSRPPARSPASSRTARWWRRRNPAPRPGCHRCSGPPLHQGDHQATRGRRRRGARVPHARPAALHAVGRDYQRLKPVGRLHEEGNIYVLDEPTTALHMSDCGHLLQLLDRLVDGGSSVIVVEHNLDVGPDGGDAGGTIVFEGPPADLLRAEGSFTGAHLARHVGAGAP